VWEFRIVYKPNFRFVHNLVCTGEIRTQIRFRVLKNPYFELSKTCTDKAYVTVFQVLEYTNIRRYSLEFFANLNNAMLAVFADLYLTLFAFVERVPATQCDVTNIFLKSYIVLFI
jgi:hypothetical protein